MKKLFYLLLFLILPLTASAGLWQYYADKGESLPSVYNRIDAANECEIKEYRGTGEQNVLLEKCLRDIEYWIERIKNNDKNPLTEAELLKIPEEAWFEVAPQIIQIVKEGSDLLGGAGQTVICRGHECDKYNGGEKLLGFSVVSGFQKTLRAGMTSTQTYFYPSNLTLKDSATLSKSVLGEKFFFTLEPGGTREEITKCTDITASTIQVSSCTRGLAFSGTSEAAVTANQKTHNAGAIVILSNVHYVYEQFVDTNYKEQTIYGPKTFASSTFAIGEGDATNNKCITINNGDANLPKICYVEGTTNKWYIYNDGVTSVDIAAGGSGVSASSTGMISINGSIVEVNSSGLTNNVLSLGQFGHALKDIVASGTLYSTYLGNPLLPSATGKDIGSYVLNWNNIFASGTLYANNISLDGTATTTFLGTLQSNSAGTSTLPNLWTNQIGPVAGSGTTTIAGHLQVNGDMDWTGEMKNTYISSDSDTSARAIDSASPTNATRAVLDIHCDYDGVGEEDGVDSMVLYKNNANIHYDKWIAQSAVDTLSGEKIRLMWSATSSAIKGTITDFGQLCDTTQTVNIHFFK